MEERWLLLLLLAEDSCLWGDCHFERVEGKEAENVVGCPKVYCVVGMVHSVLALVADMLLAHMALVGRNPADRILVDKCFAAGIDSVERRELDRGSFPAVDRVPFDHNPAVSNPDAGTEAAADILAVDMASVVGGIHIVVGKL